ncbi:hypothetical protein PENVUL_c025G07907 [Penicillium vulpinum]|uniref:Uncharacterized protein n=1 Tax=Penicillium vulpinum TaxID=29845 RepID=A0A1V6RV52_9EURO|nr:hypothetical protein PENVUL_c025G07907 [Penicillium vulpinum]
MATNATMATINSTKVVSLQGGILEGPNDGPKAQPISGLGWAGLWALWALQRPSGSPSQYDPKNPLVLFIIQIRQPRVIAEVIRGIVLGPSVMGRIRLVLFLFLVGLETDLRFLISNWRVALSVSAAGMILYIDRLLTRES